MIIAYLLYRNTKYTRSEYTISRILNFQLAMSIDNNSANVMTYNRQSCNHYKRMSASQLQLHESLCYLTLFVCDPAANILCYRYLLRSHIVLCSGENYTNVMLPCGVKPLMYYRFATDNGVCLC